VLLERYREAMASTLGESAATDSLVGELLAARRAIRAWREATRARGDLEVLRRGLRRVYRRGRALHREARSRPRDETLHEWRKQVKHLWYHLELIERLCSQDTIRLADDAHRLSDLLGDDHDLAVLEKEARGVLAGEAAAVFSMAVAGRRAQLQADAGELGARLFAEKPGALVTRLGFEEG
jgi:CHAD domain-containing protein